jgi:hypothetical protein
MPRRVKVPFFGERADLGLRRCGDLLADALGLRRSGDPLADALGLRRSGDLLAAATGGVPGALAGGVSGAVAGAAATGATELDRKSVTAAVSSVGVCDSATCDSWPSVASMKSTTSFS